MTHALDMQLSEAIQRNLDRTLDELAELVAQPSISSQNVGMEGAAALVQDLLQRHGFESELMATPGYPIVFAEAPGDQLRTLMLYNHYDVQPAEPLDLWHSPPFEATRKDGAIVGRGVADDKGHIVCRLAALDAVREVLGSLPCSVKFLIEGGEEISSPHVPEFIEDHRDLLAADACIWETGGVDFDGRPQITLGMRGICYVEYAARTMSRDAHSGFAHLLPNAAWRLVEALSSLRHERGEIAIDGFYDDARAPSEAEMELLAALPDTDDAIRRSYDIQHFVGDLEGIQGRRAVYSPTSNIAGLSSGYEGPGPKTVIPSSATAKMDFRLVPDQDPKDIYAKLVAHLDRCGFSDVAVSYLGGEQAATTPLSDPWVQLAIETARDVYRRDPQVQPLIGGSGPMHPFRHVLGVPIVTAGIGHPESLVHAPNENILVDNFVLGTRHTALLVARAMEALRTT